MVFYGECLQQQFSSSHHFQSITFLTPEAVTQRCSVRKVFLEISQNSQENTFAKVSFLIKLQALFSFSSCFPVNFAKLLRTPSVTEHLRCLLL